MSKHRFMNVQMEDAVLILNNGEQYSFDNYFVQARNIRYVHIPEKVCWHMYLL